MNEIDVLKIVNDALAELDEDEARLRVLRWACDKYASSGTVLERGQTELSGGGTVSLTSLETREIPGIARMTAEGDFRLTVRDIKAKNTNDAAVRLAHVTIGAYEQITGEGTVSSKKILSPILKEWRAYSGNTRNALSKHKGIIRQGDLLSLDAHSKADAQKFIDQILDESIQGTWKP